MAYRTKKSKKKSSRRDYFAFNVPEEKKSRKYKGYDSIVWDYKVE